MFVVKVKTKDLSSPHYCNDQIMIPLSELKLEGVLHKKYFMMQYDKAYRLYKTLISRALDPSTGSIYEYVSIVELSNYEPHTEFAVTDYREFK